MATNITDKELKQKYAKLVGWMLDNKVQFSSLLTLRESPLGGIGVFARSKIPRDSLLLTVPKTVVLSPSKYVSIFVYFFSC